MLDGSGNSGFLLSNIFKISACPFCNNIKTSLEISSSLSESSRLVSQYMSDRKNYIKLALSNGKETDSSSRLKIP